MYGASSVQAVARSIEHHPSHLLANYSPPLVLKEALVNSSTRIPFERVLPAQTSMELVVPVPLALPPTAVELDAVLLYRNIRTPYYRAATGDPTGHAPDVEVARVAVGQ